MKQPESIASTKPAREVGGSRLVRGLAEAVAHAEGRGGARLRVLRVPGGDPSIEVSSEMVSAGAAVIRGAGGGVPAYGALATAVRVYRAMEAARRLSD